MYSVVISLSCGISLNVRIAMLQIPLFNSKHFKCFFGTCRCELLEIYDELTVCHPEHKCFDHCIFSPVCECACDAFVRVCKTPRRHFRRNKGPETMLSERKRKFLFRCSCMRIVISVKRRQSLSPAPCLPFLSPSVTLVDSL